MYIVTNNNFGLDARKPVFGGLQITKVQTSLRICTDQPAQMRSLISTLVICLLDGTCVISRLDTSEISIFKLVSVAETTGLSLVLSETPRRQVLLRRGPFQTLGVF